MNRKKLSQVISAGLPDHTGGPPSQITLELKEIKQIPGWEFRQYVFTWGKSNDDKTTDLEYTMNYFGIMPDHSDFYLPLKTVDKGEALKAFFGAAQNSDYTYSETIPRLAFYVVYVKDGDGLITSSQLLAVDFINPNEPQTVLIDDTSRLKGSLFPVRVKVNGKQLSFDVPPEIQNGRTVVPLRTIFEELGAVVEWDEPTQTIKATKGETEIVLQVGNYKASVNGEDIRLDVPPQVKSGRTLVPLRFVSESLGAEVQWNQTLQLVTITK